MILWAAVTTERPIDEGQLRAQCGQRFASIFVPKRFVVLDALPTNEAGKLDRLRLAQILKAN